MHIVMFVATDRGKRVLAKLFELKPDIKVSVFSFREDPWEPPFLDNIRKLTIQHGGIFIESQKVGDKEHESFWTKEHIDIAFTINWRYMIPPEVYSVPIMGTFVFHDSLLPAYRGFSPTVWAIINGEVQTGVSLFEIAEKVDSGDLVDQEVVPIGPDDTISTVMEQLNDAYLKVFIRNLPKLLNGSALRRPQNHALATYTCKRTLNDNEISWDMDSRDIHNLIRAVSHPYPGAFTYLNGELIRVWSAQRVEAPKYAGRIPGRVVQILPGEGVVVLTGDSTILLKDIQKENGDICCAAELIKSLSLTLGR